MKLKLIKLQIGVFVFQCFYGDFFALKSISVINLCNHVNRANIGKSVMQSSSEGIKLHTLLYIYRLFNSL